MMNRLACILSLTAIATTCVAPARAQQGAYRYADATQLWRLTDNAAGLGLDHSQSRGYAHFDLQHDEGSYSRVQEGNMKNQLQFETERYQDMGPLLVGYGHFCFNMDRTKNRAWADEMRPYESNPYISGSSVPGRYDTQTFDLSAALSTIPIPLAGDGADRELTLGLRLDYKVGDLSRLRDPRSRSQLLDYRLAPAITYSFGAHALGFAAHYDRRKEKIPNITTVQEDPNLEYYLMTGLDRATATIGGYKGFSREWVSHELGGELSYQYRHGSLNSLTTAALSRANEDTWGQYKQEPGRYTSYVYKATSRNRLTTPRRLHQLDFSASFQEAYADEMRQQLVQERDATHGYTSYRYDTQLIYRKRHQLKTTDLSLHYRHTLVSAMSADTGVSAPALSTYLGAWADFHAAATKHLLPTSKLDVQRLALTLEAGHALLGDRLWIDAFATYSRAPKARLDRGNSNTVSAYTDQVLIPDMDYYAATCYKGHLALTYHFPLALRNMRSTWYVRAYADYLKTNNELDAKTIGLTIGLFN